MSSVIGTIASVDGKFHVKDSQGNIREVSVGDEIHVGEVVFGDKNNSSIDSIVVTLDNGNDLVLFGQEKQLFDTSLFDDAFAENETVSESESIEQMFSELGDEADAQNEDIDDIETEAGEEEATESTEGGEAKFAQTTGNSVDVNAELYGSSFTDIVDEEKDEEDENFELGNFDVNENSDDADSLVTLNENEFEDDKQNVQFTIAVDAVNEVFTDGRLIENLINVKNPVIIGKTSVVSEILVKEKDGNIVGRGNTDEDGRFEIELDEMYDGEHTLTFEARTEDGREVRVSTDITVDTIVNDFTADKEVRADGSATYSGTAEVGSIVSVVDKNGKSFGDVTVGDDGVYTIDIAQDADFDVKVKDIAGNEEIINVNSAFAVDTTKLLNAANDAADTANTAISAANDAVETLQANDNPTAADIAIAQNSINAADAAIITATDAATTYTSAATAAGEAPVATTEVSNTRDAQADLTAVEVVEDTEASKPTLEMQISDAVELTTIETSSTTANSTTIDTTNKDLGKNGSQTIEIKALEAHETTESMTLEIEKFKSGKDGDLVITAYDKDGNQVGDSMTLSATASDDKKHDYDFNPTNGGEFNYITVSAGDDSEVKIKKIDAAVITTTETEVVTGHSYTLDISTSLSDSTETLGDITVSPLPEGASLSAGTKNIDGTWTLTSSDLNDLKVITTTEIAADFNITVQATSTDGNSISTTSKAVIVDVDAAVTTTGSTINMGDTKDEVGTGTAGDDIINMGDGKSAKEQEAHGGEGNDTVNIDGESFKVYGEAGNDTFNISSNDFSNKSGSSSGSSSGKASKAADMDGDIDGGEGLDTLVFSDGMDIDMSALDDNISNIETINLGEGTQNITSLHTSDVLNMTDTDNILRIDGDSTDSIELNTESEWKLGDFQTTDEITGQTYDVYESVDDSGTTLEISTNITIDQS